MHRWPSPTDHWTPESSWGQWFALVAPPLAPHKMIKTQNGTKKMSEHVTRFHNIQNSQKKLHYLVLTCINHSLLSSLIIIVRYSYASANRIQSDPIVKTASKSPRASRWPSAQRCSQVLSGRLHSCVTLKFRKSLFKTPSIPFDSNVFPMCF